MQFLRSSPRSTGTRIAASGLLPVILSRRLLSLATIAIVLSFLAVTFADPDLWGHLTFGRDIVRQGWIHSRDPYSFTSDVAWVNHEWLAEAAMWLAYRGGGTVGLVALKLALVSAIGAFVLRAWSTTPLRDAHRDALLFATALGVWPLVATIRPQVFSLTLFAALMFGLKRVREGAHGWLWLIPPLFAVWVNVHGGWIVGAGALAVFTACSMFDAAFTPRARGALVVAACAAAAATLANPYGPAMLDFLSKTVGPGRADIVEWQALDRLPPLAAALWTVPAAIAAIALWRKGRSVPIAFIAIAVALGVGAVRVARLGGFFAIAVGIVLAPAVAASTANRERTPWPRGAAVIYGAATALLVLTASLVFGRHIVATGEWLPEPEAVEYVKSSHLRGRMLTWFDYGEYAIWHLSPDILVSMDGRRETVYSDAMRALHSRVYANGPEAAEVVGRLGPDYLWLPTALPVTARLQQAGWQPLFVGRRSTILGRDAAATVRAMAAAHATRFFPGP